MTEQPEASVEKTEAEAIAYALGALEADEAAAFEKRLRHDEVATSALSNAVRDLELLTILVEPSPAPASLRDRVLRAAVGAEPRTAPTALWFRRPVTWALAAAAVLVLLLGGWNLALQRELDAQRQVINQQRAEVEARERVVQAIREGDRVVALTPSGGAAVTGSVVVPRGGQPPLLLAGRLPPLGANEVYQVWIVRGTQPLSAGVFSDPAQPVVLLGFVEAGDIVAITVEPGPRGSPSPSTSPLAVARM